MKIRMLSLLLCLIMITSFMSACGNKDAGTTTDNTATNESSVNKDTSDVESGSTTDSSSSEKKKIVIVKESTDQTRVDTQKNIIAGLEAGGYVNDKNAEIIDLTMDPNDTTGENIVNQIKGIKPDVVIVNALINAPQLVAKPLGEAGIPVVLNVYTDSFLNADGTPKGNVTGLYSIPKNLQKNAFEMLNKIAPIKDKKAVFITMDGMFTKEGVESALTANGIKLKEYYSFKYVEEFEAAMKKYDADDEVGWVLVGLWAYQKKDGSYIPINQVPSQAYFTKPCVTYWDNGCSSGFLCGLGVDIPTTGTQSAELAIRILKGEAVKTIKAVEPRKTNILLNKKRADMMKIVFPADYLGSAYKVYEEFK